MVSNDYIKYTGELTINRYKKGRLVKVKKIKNAGTVALFSFICQCLSGQYSSTGYVHFLDLCSGGTTNSLFSYPASVSSYEVTTDESSGTATLTVVASFGAGIMQSSQYSNDLNFVLRDNTANKNALASSLFKSGNGNFAVAVDEVYIVTWALTFGNATTSSSSTGSTGESTGSESTGD